MCDSLTVDTCLECLVLADLHNAEKLKNAAVSFVVDNSEEFVDQVALQTLLLTRISGPFGPFEIIAPAGGLLVSLA